MRRLTRSVPSTWKSTWLLFGVTVISIGASASGRIRISSAYERPGTTMTTSGVTGLVELQGADRDPVVVGGGQGHRVAAQPGQDAGQDRPALVAGRREDDLAQRLAQHAGVDAGGRRLADGGHDRELVGLDALDAGAVVATGQLQRAVLGRQHQVDALVRQRRDQVGEQARRDRDLALLLDLARHPAVDADLQVGGGELQADLSVLSRTFASTGSVARLLTARLTVWSPAPGSPASPRCSSDPHDIHRGSVPPSVHKNTNPPSSLVGV